MEVETCFRAMGCDVHVVAAGAGSRVVDRVREELERLEVLWSRFRPDSEISRLNASAGTFVPVSPETLSLLSHAVEGWQKTDGAFDPTILRALETAGYDRSFELVGAGDGGSPSSASPSSIPGCRGIVLDEPRGEAMLPVGSAFDPGGIGKGLAADLIGQALLAGGEVEGICLNIGGDLRATGRAPGYGPWLVAVEDPFDGRERARIAIEDGAVATSSRTRRRWVAGGEPRHHLIDPRTGASAWSGLAAVTVVTAEAWWAEVIAKAAFVGGLEARSMLQEREIPALLIADDGTAHTVAGMESWLG